jgi:hypothetical protein
MIDSPPACLERLELGSKGSVVKMLERVEERRIEFADIGATGAVASLFGAEIRRPVAIPGPEVTMRVRILETATVKLAAYALTSL